MILRYIFLLGSLLYPVSAAEEPAIMKTVRSLYSDKTTLETSFTLHIFWKVREKEETKSGRMYLAPGEKFRVELGPASWVCNGETFWQSSNDEKGEQVVIKRLADVEVASYPSHLLSNYLGKYRYAEKETKGGVVVVEWKADTLSHSSEAACIRLSIDAKSGVIEKLFIIDANGNESEYTFKKAKFSPRLPGKTFEFTVPKGASVIDMRK